jgi:hypothetical protein
MDMQEYKGYFIDGCAKMVHPFSPPWHPGGSVLRSGPSGSVIEVARFELPLIYSGIKGRGGSQYLSTHR